MIDFVYLATIIHCHAIRETAGIETIIVLIYVFVNISWLGLCLYISLLLSGDWN